MTGFDYTTYFKYTNSENNLNTYYWLKDNLGEYGVNWTMDDFPIPCEINVVCFKDKRKQFLFEIQFAEVLDFITHPDQLRETIKGNG